MSNMMKLKRMAIEKATKVKRIYDAISVFLMIATLLSLLFIGSRTGVLFLLLTMLALLSSNSSNTTIQIMENDLNEKTLDDVLNQKEE